VRSLLRVRDCLKSLVQGSIRFSIGRISAGSIVVSDVGPIALDEGEVEIRSQKTEEGSAVEDILKQDFDQLNENR
jgi:hypothetical protein